jgi:hypothetical protein
MQPVEFFLDSILRQLQQDRKKPVTEREHLNADIVLREIIKTDRHEDFLEMIEILKEDGMIRRVNEAEKMEEIDKSRDVLITVKGSLLIENGGYAQKFKNEKSDRELRDSRDKRLSNGTVYLAIGTFLLVLVEALIHRHELLSLFSCH